MFHYTVVCIPAGKLSETYLLQRVRRLEVQLPAGVSLHHQAFDLSRSSEHLWELQVVGSTHLCHLLSLSSHSPIPSEVEQRLAQALTSSDIFIKSITSGDTPHEHFYLTHLKMLSTFTPNLESSLNHLKEEGCCVAIHRHPGSEVTIEIYSPKAFDQDALDQVSWIFLPKPQYFALASLAC